jgi:hypothetical protein
MIWTWRLLGWIGHPCDCITGVIRKRDLSSLMNEWREILTPAERNLGSVFPRVDISMRQNRLTWPSLSSPRARNQLKSIPVAYVLSGWCNEEIEILVSPRRDSCKKNGPLRWQL